MKTIPTERIQRYRRTIEGRAVKTIVQLECAGMQAGLDPRANTLDVFPDGTMTLNGQRILKSELPAWAKKYVP